MPRNEKRLDAFTRAYIETALWSSTDNADDSGGEPLDKNYGIEDIAPETMELIVEDCADFQKRFDSLIIEEPEVRGEHTYGRWELAGHDFWLTRVGSGAGFWDGDWPKNGDELAEAAKSYGSFDLSVGDDGVIYGPPPDWYRSHHHRGNVERLTGKPANPPALKERTTVRDFDTRDELVDHAKGEGATHVVVVGSGATIYFPTSGGKYEEARAWRQNGYWHAPAPGARKVVDSLPRDAQPIGGARRAAESPSTRHKHYEVTADGDGRHGQRLGDLIHGEPSEITEFDGPAFPWIELFERLETAVESHEVPASLGLKAHHVLQ